MALTPMGVCTTLWVLSSTLLRTVELETARGFYATGSDELRYLVSGTFVWRVHIGRSVVRRDA